MVCGRYVLTDVADILHVVDGILACVRRCTPLTEERAFFMKLVLNELLANSCVHAGRAMLLYRVEADDFKCCVLDDGDGFAQPDAEPACPPPDAEHGRGIYLVRRLARRVRYNRRGNVVLVDVQMTHEPASL